MRSTWRAFAIGTVFAILFSYMAVVALSRFNKFLPSTQISSISILFCLILVLLINPVLRLLRFAVLSRQEIILVFIMATVPAGIPVYGYVGEVVPLIAGLHHPEWNTPQSQWNEMVVPYVNPDLFVGDPLFQARDVKDWQGFCAQVSQARAAATPSPYKRLAELLPADALAAMKSAGAGKPYTAAQEDAALQRWREHKASREGKKNVSLADWEKTLALEQLARETQATIVRAVGNVLARREFYAPAYFRGLQLPAAGQTLLERPRESLILDEIKRLNRMILEAALPDAIIPSDYARDQQVLVDYVRGMRARDREPWPVFVKNPDESFGQWAARAKRYATRTPALTTKDVVNWWALCDLLAAASSDTAPLARRRLWDALGLQGQTEVGQAIQVIRGASQEQDAAAQGLDAAKASILAQLNQRLARKDLYDAAAFRGLALEADAQRLIARGPSALSGAETQVLNRLLLEASLPKGLRRYTMRFMGEVPWGSWITPLAHWIFIALVFFLLFYSLNEVLFKQWYKHEQLSFPIAQFSAIVLTGEGEKEEGRLVPRVFRNPYMWVGFAIAFGILFYNGMIRAHWLTGMNRINIYGSMWHSFYPTFLRSLLPFRFEVYFTVIGLAFLLPTEVSFSIWFFYIFRCVQQVTAVWLGYGVDGWSFRGNWYDKCSFLTAQGGGALLVIGGYYLWRVRHKFFAFLYRLAWPRGSANLPQEEVKEYTVPSTLFFLASLGVLYIMLASNVSWGMAIFTYFALLLLTVAFTRVVAECGLISYQFFFGPFHLMKIFGLLRFPFLFAVRGLGTVLMILQGLFLDIKVFIAPTMINAKNLAVRNKVSNRSFALSIGLGVMIALVVASVVAVLVPYDFGLASANAWLYRSLPRHSFNNITHMMNDVEGMSSMDGSMAAWFCVGVVTCGALMYARQFIFWLPHPIGLTMLNDNLSKFFWFSFFLAWICKRAAVKYCDIEQYRTVRGFFIGLVLGAVAAVGLAMIIGLFFDPNMQLSLNPHGR